MAAAQAELHVLARAIRERVPDLNRDRSIHAQNAGKLMAGMTSTVTPVFFLLMGITFLVLFAACANIANLMLARASARTREIATRLAVGASRSRLLRQLITEGVFLGVAGGALGVALSELAGSQLSHFRLPVPIPIDINVSADGRVLGFAVTLSIITGVIFSLIPAWRATKPDLIGSIKNDTGSIASMRRFGLRNVLVVVQIGISTIETHIRESMILPRLAAILFGLCGGIGLLIASIGVYGVISFAVARRTKEIGIRMALGARASHVLRMVLKHGVAASLIGIGFGIAAGMAVSRVTRSLLFGVSAIDPLTFSCVAVLLFSVALLATVIPARRAVAIDPNQTLRAE